MIRRCREKDIAALHEIINDAAQAYKGVIPPDRWHEPYMPLEELARELFGACHLAGHYSGSAGSLA